MPKDFACGFEILPHHHERAQLIYATAGTMRVSTEDGVWVVPPQRAVWMPAGVTHSLVMLSDTTMRTLYVRDDAAASMPTACRVLSMTPLAARADRARDRAAGAVRRKRPGRPCRRPDPVRAAGPAVAAACSCRCRATRACGRSARPCSMRPAISGRSRHGPRPSTPAPAPSPAASRARPASASAPGGSRRACSRRWAGWAAAHPVTEVALDLGYESVSAFSAMFHRATGASPSQFRGRPQAQ